MNDLLKLTIEAHGGLENRSQFENIHARLKVGGTAWSYRGQAGVLDDINIIASTKTQLASFHPFIHAGWHNTFTPEKVSISDGQQIVDELVDPRSSFQGYKLETPWSKLQLTYFSGYAMWTYLNTPFIFANPGYQVKELEPWEENNELFRRLQVTFPKGLATHSAVQILYIDQEGLIRRHDYDVEIIGNAPSANYIDDYVTIQGIRIGTKRRVYIRQDDNTPKLPTPILVAIDISEIAFK